MQIVEGEIVWNCLLILQQTHLTCSHRQGHLDQLRLLICCCYSAAPEWVRSHTFCFAFASSFSYSFLRRVLDDVDLISRRLRMFTKFARMSWYECYTAPMTITLLRWASKKNCVHMNSNKKDEKFRTPYFPLDMIGEQKCGCLVAPSPSHVVIPRSHIYYLFYYHCWLARFFSFSDVVISFVLVCEWVSE